MNLQKKHIRLSTTKSQVIIRIHSRILVKIIPAGPTSRRPGRKIASSIMSFLLVMPMMRMLFRLSTPSILDNSWFTILSDTPVESANRVKLRMIFFFYIQLISLPLVDPLLFMMASISSNMMMCSMLESPAS